MWGIGDRLAARHGINTALELRDADFRLVRKEMGVVGERMVRELRGDSCIPLDLCPQPRKSVISSRSFGRPVEGIDGIRESVAYHVAIAALKLRRQGSVAGVLSVFFHTSRHKPGTPQYGAAGTYPLPVSTACTLELTRYAERVVGTVYRPGHAYVKAGVMLDDITSAKAVQGNLFDDADRGKSERLMAVMDSINDALGAETIRLGAAGVERKKAKFERRTPRDTTSWEELATVR